MRRALWLALVSVAIGTSGCGGASLGEDVGVSFPRSDATGDLDPGERDDTPGDARVKDVPDGEPGDTGPGDDSTDVSAVDPGTGDLADSGDPVTPDAAFDLADLPADSQAIDSATDPAPDSVTDPAPDPATDTALDLAADPAADLLFDAGADLVEDPGADSFLDSGEDISPIEPGLAIAHAIYPHTAKELFVWNGSLTPPMKVGNFTFPDDGLDHRMTDMAIDYDGRLYGVTFGGLYRCRADTARCTNLASFEEEFNGMTIVPAGTILPGAESIVAISSAGGWYRVDVSSGPAVLTHQGDYGSGYTSAGDAYSIAGSGTWAAVNKGMSGSLLVQVDPVTGAVLQDLGSIPGENIWGLAGWYSGKVFAFDSSGTIFLGDSTSAATFKPYLTTSHAWYGAAVSTRDPH